MSQSSSRSPNFEPLFDLLNQENDDFPFLIKRYRIDVANELRHSDLRQVDFGALSATTLDLTGCDLTGADLSRVYCQKIILTNAITTRAKLPPQHKSEPEQRSVASADALDTALIVIQAFESNNYYANEFVKSLPASRAPSLGLYSTAAEQDYLTRLVITEAGRGWVEFLQPKSFFVPRAGQSAVPAPEGPPLPIMWLYTRRTNRFDTGRVNFWELDREIAKLAANAEVVHPELNRGINPDLIARNQRLMEALRQDILIMSTNAQPNAFVGFLRRNRISTLIMSGFPPMSLDMYEKLSKSIKTFKLIALCPGTADSAFKNIRGSVRKEIVPNRPFAVPARVTADDLWSLSVRVRTATNGAVMITRPFIERMLDRNETVALVDAKKVLTSALNRVKKRRRSMSVGTISI